MLNLRSRVFLLAVLCVTASGCGILGPQTCTSVLKAGMTVSLIDARTGAFVVSSQITLTVTDDDGYLETRTESRTAANAQLSLFAASERPGVYTVEVVAAGYAPWRGDNVRVTRKDDCHVNTTEVQARMQPLTA